MLGSKVVTLSELSLREIWNKHSAVLKYTGFLCRVRVRSGKGTYKIVEAPLRMKEHGTRDGWQLRHKAFDTPLHIIHVGPVEFGLTLSQLTNGDYDFLLGPLTETFPLTNLDTLMKLHPEVTGKGLPCWISRAVKGTKTWDMRSGTLTATERGGEVIFTHVAFQEQVRVQKNALNRTLLKVTNGKYDFVFGSPIHYKCN